MSSAEPSRVTSVSAITSIVSDGVALLARQFAGQPRIEALLSALLQQVQDLETAAYSVYTLSLATATDAQLDQFGDLLSVPRGSLSDSNYRIVLQGAAIAIASSGTVSDLYRIADIVFKDVDFTVTEHRIASVVIRPENVVAIGPSLALSVLARAKAAGVRLLMVDPRGSSSGRFRFSPTTETVVDANHGLSDVAGSSGGRLVGILEA